MIEDTMYEEVSVQYSTTSVISSTVSKVTGDKQPGGDLTVTAMASF